MAVQRAMSELADRDDAADAPFRYVFRHLPLQLRHPHAEQASVAAEAAARQGAFWDMHEQLFTHQDRLEDEDLRMYASSIGLDIDQFEDDLHDEVLHDRVMDDRNAAVQSGVRRTSNLFINGQRYQDALNPEAIARVVRRRAAADGPGPAGPEADDRSAVPVSERSAG
jgi:protein-disulfide isomerase